MLSEAFEKVMQQEACLQQKLQRNLAELHWVQVVAHERPDLQAQAAELVRQLGEYTITLKELEDNLLARLANSQVSTCGPRCCHTQVHVDL